MPSFYSVATGNTGAAQDVDQLINALNGTAGQGVPIAITGPNDSVNFALAVKNNEVTNSRALQVLRANNAVLIQADANGVVVSPDGVATAAQVLTISTTQTLTNKSFGGSPEITLTSAASRIVPGATSISLRNNANNADNLIITDAGAATFRSSITTAATGLLALSISTTGGAGVYAGQFINSGGASNSNGVYVQAGDNASDYGLRVKNAANSADLLGVRGDGILLIGGRALDTSATAGGNGAPPAQVAGYFQFLDSTGTARKIPCYNV